MTQVCNKDTNKHGAEGARWVCCFWAKKLECMHQDKVKPAEAHAGRVQESTGKRDWETERKWMLTAFKTPMRILCHCFLSAPLLASAISHHSVYCMPVCLQASQSGSVTLCCFSSWLLLFLLHSPSLFYLFYPTFPLPVIIPLSFLPLFLSYRCFELL